MSSQTLVILNPASAAGRTGRRAGRILERIEARLGPVSLAKTEGPGAARAVARDAARRGLGRLLIAGGDGTVSEVVDGLLGGVSAAARPPLGLLPLGSGRDLFRALDLPPGLDDALGIVAAGATRVIDAGRLEYRDARGRPGVRYFVNEASAGLSGKTVQIVGRVSKRLGARLGFALGAVAAIATHRPVPVAVEVDGARIFEGPVSLVVAANGTCFGAGMRIAPDALLDDGRLEVVLVRGLSVPRLLWNLPSLYRGRHGRHPMVSFHPARSLTLLPKEAGAPVDLDGESAGSLPLLAEIVPGAIRVFAPAAGGRRA